MTRGKASSNPNNDTEETITMAERDLDIEVTDDNRAALEGALEKLSRTSDEELMNGGDDN